MRYPEFDGTQACAEVGIEFFFPESLNEAGNLYAKAREVCRRCDWEIECADWAVHHDSGYGMFGGLTPEERRVLRRKLGVVNEPLKVVVPKRVDYAS